MRCPRIRPPAWLSSISPRFIRIPHRTLTTTPPLLGKPMPPRPKIIESEISEKFLCGSGPGGQKINKTSSAVQLIHLPTGTVLKCQATRSRIQNRTIARRLLAEKLEAVTKGAESRVAIKGEVKRRKKAKKRRRSLKKYRALDGLAEGATSGEMEGDEEAKEQGNSGKEVVESEKGDGAKEEEEWMDADEPYDEDAKPEDEELVNRDEDATDRKSKRP